MKNFVVYDRLTGEILRTGASPHPETQAHEGEGVIVGKVTNPDTTLVLNGELVPKPAAQIEEKKAINASRAARHLRTKLLAASDWTQVVDAPVDRAAWATYRQALRDITAQGGFPYNIVWPEPPR
jgi:hypothetical protein